MVDSHLIPNTVPQAPPGTVLERRALSKPGNPVVWPHNRILGVVKVFIDESLIRALRLLFQKKDRSPGRAEAGTVRQELSGGFPGVSARGGLSEGTDLGLQPTSEPLPRSQAPSPQATLLAV